jgi:hypothetical protein
MCMICLNQSKGKPFFLVQLWQKIILYFLRWTILGSPWKRILQIGGPVISFQ